MTSQLSRPNTQPIAGQYSLPVEQDFMAPSPASQGHAQPIPNNKVGITAQQVFHKINHALNLGKPLAKIVIGTQQGRF